jgi:DNA-binding HxlR family transcriptional regulator
VKPIDDSGASDLSDKDATARALLALVGAGRAISEQIERLTDNPMLAGNAPIAVIVTLWRFGPMRPTVLAKTYGMTTGGMTKVIERLEEAGVVTKDKDDSHDGRKVSVNLTEAGLTITNLLLESLSSPVGVLLDELAGMRADCAVEI